MNREKLQQFILSKRFERTWQSVFAEVSIESEEEALTYICTHVENKERLFNELYVQAYQMQYELNNIDFMDMGVSEAIKIVSGIKDKFDKLEEEYIHNIVKAIENLTETSKKIRYLSDELLKMTLFYVTCNKEWKMLNVKIKDFNHKMTNMILSFGVDDLVGNTDNIFHVLKNDLETIEKINDKRTKKESKDLIEEYKKIQKQNNNTKYLKIFDYKEMLDLAKSEGYTAEIRYHGDHIIVTHENSEKIVVIPAHELGYGLMIQIQKQIKTNKVTLN